ncbi:MAG TPA: hypothetical protein VMB47_07465 [Candidatus Aquilonibacter sp.]|nr:hypothetical protein [Candidatus Aquilonibacter sp.]
MRNWRSLSSAFILVGVLAVSAAAQGQADQAQSASGSSSGQVTTVNQAIDRIIAREHDEVATIKHYTPIIETYIQDMKPDPDMGAVPVKDHYYLGQANLATGVVDNSMLADKTRGKLDEFNPLAHLSGYFSSDYVPAGFLQMIYVDPNGFDRQHYEFDYIRAEFLGDVRCLVFDVTPLPKSGRGRFKGRIWAEDQNYTIVRFNGVFTPIEGINGYNLHFDSWRLNVQPGLWLPAYVFSQESDLRDVLGNHIRFKSQTRLWGYNLKNASHEQELTELTVEAPGTIQGQTDSQQDVSPIEAEREWQHTAEVNVLDRLQRDGLLAPPGDVDKVLEAYVNNIEVGNNLDIEPEVHCRVLLTGTLEAFSIGHTIVVSRGLLDALPDDGSLATVLAQELADIMVTKPSTDQWGFDDTTNVSTVEALSRFSFRDNPDDMQKAAQKAVALLKNSIYKDKLGSAGLFLKELDAESKDLPALIDPRLGNRVAAFAGLVADAPALKPDDLDQIAALPIGSRIKLDPWNDDISLLKPKPITLISAREKMPFQVTPFEPYLTRYEKPGANVNAEPSHADVAAKQVPAAQTQTQAQPQGDPQ